MPQFRLTQKFAQDVGVENLQQPRVVTDFFDDWAIDYVIIQRKKVALITHVKSFLSFFIPYQTVSGSKNVPENIGIWLSRWLCQKNFKGVGDKVITFFKRPYTFCKTNERKLIGHMNDFKRCTKARIYYLELQYTQVDWDEEASVINSMPIKTITSHLSTPEKLMLQLCREGSDNLPK